MTEKNNTADLLPANWKQMSLEEKFNHVQREFVFSVHAPPLNFPVTHLSGFFFALMAGFFAEKAFLIAHSTRLK